VWALRDALEKERAARHLPNTTPHAPTARCIPLFQRSVLPSHPLTTLRPPTIVYPHRLSTPPLASSSTPPHEAYLFLAADPTQRTSSYVPLRVHRVTVAPTPSYVERVVHVAAKMCSRRWRVPLCTREVPQLSACSGTVLGWVCVCSVPQGAQLRAAGWRAARGGTTLVQAASLPRGGEAHPPHSGDSAGHPPARADGGELTHGELPLSEPDATHARAAADDGEGGRVGGAAG
jgi:hypothetical protein